jgi:hypothetical protein
MQLLSHSQNFRAPLDVLVVLQLEAIIDSEKQLRERYDGLIAKPSADDSEGWAEDVWKLRLQTDRLARLLDALDGKYQPADSTEEITPIAA